MAVFAKRYALQILVVLAVLDCHQCYTVYRSRIPNGDNVPNPCNNTFGWYGVGHIKRQGAGELNAFGIDFRSNGYTWNSTLCHKDSDGDGRTNGVELGDPSCMWTLGDTPQFTSGITHPGFCEPLDSSSCQNSDSEAIDCNDLEFQCEALSKEGVETRTVQMTSQDVTLDPGQTEYRCMKFEYPTDGNFQLIGATPALDTDYVLEMMLFGCTGNLTDLGVPYSCFMAPWSVCAQPLVIWSAGSDGLCVDTDLSFPVGTGEGAFMFGALKVQYFNPLDETVTIQDRSGFNMAITAQAPEVNTQTQASDVGVLMVGQTFLQIPPGRESYLEKGKCAARCTSTRMSGPIKIIAVLPHMHALGRKLEIIKRSRTQKKTILVQENNFKVSMHKTQKLQEEVTLYPGEEIEVRCFFNSMSRNATTFFGFTTMDEMCQGVITYYPKKNFEFQGGCTSRGPIAVCRPFGPIVEECQMAKLLNSSHPEVNARYQRVFDNCSPDECLPQCLEVAKEILSHPCYSDRMKIVLTNVVRNEAVGENRSAHDRFWASVSSCDAIQAGNDNSNRGKP